MSNRPPRSGESPWDMIRNKRQIAAEKVSSDKRTESRSQFIPDLAAALGVNAEGREAQTDALSQLLADIQNGSKKVFVRNKYDKKESLVKDFNVLRGDVSLEGVPNRVAVFALEFVRIENL